MSARCRAAAARVLAATIVDGESLSHSLPHQLERVDQRDKALLQQLCYGTLRSYHRLQGIIQQLLKKPLKSRDADIQALMLYGAYQLLEMRTPDHAAISTAVEACRLLKKNWATGLVNGVLRRCLRERVQLIAALSESQQASHPQWLFTQIQQHWPRQSPDIFAANNNHPPFCLRVNQRRTTVQQYLAQLAGEGIEARPGNLGRDTVRLDSARDVTRLPGFAAGFVSVQDEAAQLAGELLRPAADDRILDACSAPGGKTCHLLELQPDIGELIAMDSDPVRLQRVQENLQRLDLHATLLQADACNPPPQLANSGFDRILLDAPCSGTGVIRRHPDIKLLRRDSDINELAATQLQMLQALWPLLRPGGSLLYVTCSILPAENSELVAAFLTDCANARSVPLDVSWGEDCNPGRQLLPERDGPDGLYFALLHKASA